MLRYQCLILNKKRQETLELMRSEMYKVNQSEPRKWGTSSFFQCLFKGRQLQDAFQMCALVSCSHLVLQLYLCQSLHLTIIITSEEMSRIHSYFYGLLCIFLLNTQTWKPPETLNLFEPSIQCCIQWGTWLSRHKKTQMLKKRSSTGSDCGLTWPREAVMLVQTFHFFLQWRSRHFWHRVSTVSGCFDKQAGERPWIGSSEEAFFQVGQNKGPSHDHKALLTFS